MEDILIRVGSQAANFAIRSGLGYASKFAFIQVNKFIQVARRSYEVSAYVQGAPDEVTPELEKLRKRLENKIKVAPYTNKTKVEDRHTCYRPY
jgi:RanGTP-binding protein